MSRVTPLAAKALDMSLATTFTAFVDIGCWRSLGEIEMEQGLYLQVSSSDAGRQQAKLRELRLQLAKSGLSADLLHEEQKAGSRSDLGLISQLAVAFVASGGVTVLIECLKAFLSKNEKITIEVKSNADSAGGEKGTVVNLDNVSDVINKIVSAAN